MIKPRSLQVDKRRARLAFERSAASYDAVAVLQQEVAARMLQRLDLLAHMKPSRALDLGAGTGQVARALVRRYRGCRVIALDIALAMLRRASAARRWSRKPLAVCGDAESLPLANASVDLICSSLAVHWCNDIDRVLGEMRRVLAPGGVVLLTTLGPDTLSELRASWMAADAATHVNGFIDMHHIGDAMVRAGFTDPVLDMEMMRLTYRDVSHLMRDLKRLGAHNNTYGRPRGLTGKGRLERVRLAYESFRTSEDVLPASFEVIHAHAWADSPHQLPFKTTGAGREVRVRLARIQRTPR
jgi:malonyl-CoA O-methyltransferase